RAIGVEQQKVQIQQRCKMEQALYELERLEQHLKRWSMNGKFVPGLALHRGSRCKINFGRCPV
ncbi:hypothetical protein GQ44DRAFT_623117, partial [Phaeosphaeriaceae sp. PMI808]